MSENREPNFTRRDFIGALAVTGAAGLAASCGGSRPPRYVDAAPDGPLLRAGVVGCGGRGTGAAENFLKAGPNLKIAALADVFSDRLGKCRRKLAEKHREEIPDERCFVGFDAFRKLIATDVDVVILATPPHFRPQHFDAAVDARKHVFMEKPVAVDPTGVRAVLAAAERAKTLGLTVVTGTQRRHQREYIETARRVADGAIGRITAGRCYWNQGQLWHRPRQAGWSDMEAMLRDWVNWAWLSGDHIVEQHVHNLDVIHWFTGKYPVQALGMGARLRRPTGDQFDFFAVDYAFEDGMHVESMCRQIEGCSNLNQEYLVGTSGSTNCKNTIYDPDGKIVWQYQEPGQEAGKSAVSPYDQEHVDLVTAIRTNEPINEAENTARSTLAAIMGRMSAYTGIAVTWQEAMQSDIRLGPKEYALGPVPTEAVVPLPGTEKVSEPSL